MMSLLSTKIANFNSFILIILIISTREKPKEWLYREIRLFPFCQAPRDFPALINVPRGALTREKNARARTAVYSCQTRRRHADRGETCGTRGRLGENDLSSERAIKIIEELDNAYQSEKPHFFRS